MDWIGDNPPTEHDLVGRAVIEQATTRFEAIAKTGGKVLGERELSADGLVAQDPYDFSIGAAVEVWGWATICDRADELLDSR